MVKKSEDWGSSEDRITSKLLDESTFFLTGDIEEDNVNDCVRWLVYENLGNKEGKIVTLYINSQGGDMYQALGLIDIMNKSKVPIRTIGYGSVMSSAFLILSSGTKGERYIYKNTGIMCHQFSSVEDLGKYHDIKATRKETDRLHRAMHELLKDATGLDGRTVKNKLLPANDVYLTAEEMVSLGAADYIL